MKITRKLINFFIWEYAIIKISGYFIQTRYFEVRIQDKRLLNIHIPFCFVVTLKTWKLDIKKNGGYLLFLIG